MEELSWWEALLALTLGSSTPEVLSAPHTLSTAGVQSQRTQFSTQAKKRLRQFEWTASDLNAKHDWQMQTQALPKPKHQMLSMQLQASERLGPSLTNHISMNIGLQPWSGESDVFVMSSAVALDFFGERIHSASETLWHRGLGSLQGWNDSTIDSEWWHTVQRAPWIAPLADGSMPKTFSMSATTSNISLKKPVATRYATALECQSSKPYAGHTVHPNIEGQVQLVDCQRTVNGKPMFTLQSLYLLDYQYSIPTGDHLFDRRWQWQVVSFQNRPNTDN